MDQIKILFIHHAKGWGGAPLNMINIINSLEKDKYLIKVLLIKDSIVSEKLKENNIDFVVASSFFHKKIYNYFPYTEPGYIKWYRIYPLIRMTVSWLMNRYCFAEKELKKHDFDIVHLNSSVLTDWLAPCYNRGKVLYHIQEPLAFGVFGIRFNFFRNQVKKYSDRIIAISLDNAERINIPEKTDVIYNYSELSPLKPSILSYHSKKVLYLGGSAYIKGFYILVEALDYIDPDIKIYFAGNFSSNRIWLKIFPELFKFFFPNNTKKNLALQKIKNHPNVKLIGLTSNVKKYLDEVCCLVSPFIVPHFSRPIIEAFANYKPVIATNIKGNDEIVTNYSDGLLVNKNPHEIAKAINQLCNNPELLIKMGNAGYSKAKLLFSPKNILKFEKVYFELNSKAKTTKLK